MVEQHRHAAAPKSPTVSADTRTYVYDLESDTCGIVVSLAQGKKASDYDVPTVQVLVADVWKKMDVEVEWAFDPRLRPKDYSGRVETYDGRVADFHPLEGDTSTKITGPHTWQSRGQIAARRGIRFSLLYMGTSKWRKEQPFTSQRDDVARTIVTLWTKGGQLFVSGGRFGKRTDPRTRIWILCPSHVEADSVVSEGGD